MPKENILKNEKGNLQLSDNLTQILANFHSTYLLPELPQRGKSDFFKERISSLVNEIQSKQNDLQVGLQINNYEMAESAASALTMDISILETLINNPNYCYTEEEAREHKESMWAELMKDENLDSETRDTARDIKDLDDSVVETKKYADEAFLNTSSVLRNAQISNYLNSLSDEELSLTIEEALQSNLSVEDLKKLSETKEILSDLKEAGAKAEYSQKEVEAILTAIQFDMYKHQNFVHTMEDDYSEKSVNLFSAMKEKCSQAMSQIKSDAINFGKDAMTQSGAALNKIYFETGNFLENMKSKIQSMKHDMDRKLVLGLEKITFGGFSAFIDKLKEKKLNFDAYQKDIYLIDPKTKAIKEPVPPKLSDYLATYIISNINPDIVNNLEQDAWKDGISPIHKLEKIPEKIGEKYDKTKDSISDIKDSVKQDIIDLNSKISNLGKSIVDKGRNILTQTKINLLEIQANGYEALANIAEKMKNKANTKYEKYKKIDKTIFEATENINKSIHNLTAIQPYQKKEYHLSAEMQAQLNHIEKMQNLPGLKNYQNTLKKEIQFEQFKGKMKTGIDNLKTNFPIALHNIGAKIENTLVNFELNNLNKESSKNVDKMINSYKKLQVLSNIENMFREKSNESLMNAKSLTPDQDQDQGQDAMDVELE